MTWLEWSSGQLINLKYIQSIYLIDNEVSAFEIGDDDDREVDYVRIFETQEEAIDFYEEIKSKLVGTQKVLLDLAPPKAPDTVVNGHRKFDRFGRFCSNRDS